MGIDRPAVLIRPYSRRAAALVVAGTIPLSFAVICAAPATADPQVSGNVTLQTPYGPAVVADPAVQLAAFEIPRTISASPLDAARADSATVIPADRTLAADDPETPGPSEGTELPPPVAPIEPSADRIRIGDLQLDRPTWLPPEIGAQINDGAAGTTASLARALESTGLEPSRSDRIANHIVGTTAIGTAVGVTVGNVVASPVAIIGGVIGAVCGAIAGLPGFPMGMVAVTAAGAAIGWAFVAAPAVAVGAAAGAAIGATVGAVEGYLAPDPVPDQQQATP
jgi:hypothetical protein